MEMLWATFAKRKGCILRGAFEKVFLDELEFPVTHWNWQEIERDFYGIHNFL